MHTIIIVHDSMNVSIADINKYHHIAQYYFLVGVDDLTGESIGLNE